MKGKEEGLLPSSLSLSLSPPLPLPLSLLPALAFTSALREKFLVACGSGSSRVRREGRQGREGGKEAFWTDRKRGVWVWVGRMEGRTNPCCSALPCILGGWGDKPGSGIPPWCDDVRPICVWGRRENVLMHWWGAAPAFSKVWLVSLLVCTRLFRYVKQAYFGRLHLGD